MCGKSDDISFLGYHGTISCFAASINKYGFDPEKTDKRNKHWLGNGVYFFENKALAMWWAAHAKRNHKGIVSEVVYSVNISVKKDRYADLDSLEKISEFWGFVLQFLECTDKVKSFDINLNNRQSIRKIRGIFFDNYKENYGYDVLKKTFLKKRASYLDLNLNKIEEKIINTLADTLNVYTLETQYCVSNKNCISITECDWIYSELEGYV